MAHNHDEHNQIRAAGRRALTLSLIITAGIMVVEAIGGILSDSLALLGDAGHMLVDALALALTLFALNIARRPATSTRTFGFLRAEIVAALINGSILVILSLAVFYESYQRFLNPPEVNTGLMIGIAAIGLAGNAAGIVLLRRTGKMNLNIKAAFWHVVGDTISSLGVIAAGVVIMLTGWSYADPLIAVIIGFIILYGAIQLVRESLNILLEAVPKEITVDKVTQALTTVENVVEIHDVHVWTITSGVYAMSAHLVVNDLMVSQTAQILEQVNSLLSEDYNITHTTFQMECRSCPTGNVCGINLPPADHDRPAE
jgi:cobalt-zinc-cadmium efflux system protein